MKKNHINHELINKLAAVGVPPYKRPTRANLAQLADPASPLTERIRLLQAIAGGPIHYADIADCLGEDRQQVFIAKLILGERPRDTLYASTYIVKETQQ
ncbi:MAG: hypothetical protein JW934_19040 [Anaerolineae bacterium]|nr:hypothetical protein [Anaerolineae bacterium]